MRLPIALLAAAATFITAAAAQETPPAAQPTEAAKAEPGLSDLSTTVETLQDTPPPAEPPAEQPAPAPAETAAPPAEAPAEAAATPPAETRAPAPTVPAGSRFVEPLTSAQRDELVAAAARGRLIGAIAAAGQLATRDMLARIADPDAAGIAGWIAEPEGNGVTVTFYGEPAGDAPPGAVFRANILGGRVVSREIFLAAEGRPALSRTQARMAAARRTAAGQDHRPCGGDQFNYFVVPPAGPDGPIDVYQISPQTARGRFPVGGHFRTTIAADGTIAATRGFTNACIDIEAGEVPAGQRAAPLAVTHLMDPLPTEIHAFLSLWTGHPLIVVAGDPQRLFAVTGDGIAEVPRDGPAGR